MLFLISWEGENKKPAAYLALVTHLSQSVQKGQETNGVSTVKASWFLLPSGWYPAAHDFPVAPQENQIPLIELD